MQRSGEYAKIRRTLNKVKRQLLPVEIQETIIDIYVNQRAFFIQRFWKKVSLRNPFHVCFLCGRKSKFLERLKGCTHPECFCSLHVCHHNKCSFYSRLRPYLLMVLKYWMCWLVTVFGIIVFHLIRL